MFDQKPFRQKSLQLTASLLAGGLLLAGCSASQSGQSANVNAKKENSMRHGDKLQNLQKAEAAVSADPRNAELRRILADVYQSNGRYISAEQSYQDAMALGDTQPRTIISLAMSQIANGKNSAALQTLNSNKNSLPIGDYGLAMALAGDSKTGVNSLVEAICSGQNNMKVRQNLAMSYALDGRVREANIMASQDLGQAEASQRVEQWALLAGQDNGAQRVAAVMGVSPVADSGQPVQLALANNPSTGQLVQNIGDNATASEATQSRTSQAQALAQADSEKAPSYAQSSYGQNTVRAASFPSSQPPKAATPSYAAAPVTNTAPKPLPRPQTAPAPQSAPPAYARASAPVQSSNGKRTPILEFTGKGKAKQSQANPNQANMTRASIAPPQSESRTPIVQTAHNSPASGYMVQLGAFSSPGYAEKAWGNYLRRYSDLNNYQSTSTSAKVRGRTFYRLSATGFSGKADAMGLCSSIKAKGGNCIVRKANGNGNGYATVKSSNIASASNNGTAQPARVLASYDNGENQQQAKKSTQFAEDSITGRMMRWF